MTLSLEESERGKFSAGQEEEASVLVKPTAEEDKAALDDLLGFLDNWEKEGTEVEELETSVDNNIVSIPKSVGLEYKQHLERVSQTEAPEVHEIPVVESKSQFPVYDDEIAPVPLDDYTPMEIEEDATVQEPQIVQEPPIVQEQLAPGELPPLEEVPPPDFKVEFMEGASEYETEFVLDQESETFENVLKDLGWSEEEED